MRVWMGRVQAAVQRFVFAPASPRPLAALRIGLGAVLLVQAALVAPGFQHFYAGDGLVQAAIAPFFHEPGTPQVAHIAAALGRLGVREAASLTALGLAYVLALAAMTAGWHTRAATALSWFLHWTFMVSGSASNYGVEIFAHVFLFYLIFLPAGEALSLDVRAGRATERWSATARLGLRFLQVQLCLTYFSSGFEKSLGQGWWNGEALWQALMLPDYRQLDFGWLASYPLLPTLGGWATMVVETFYGVFIWPLATRRWWILAVVGMHLGIAVCLGLTVFGLIMAVLTMTLFGVPATVPVDVTIGRGSTAPGWAARMPLASAWRHRSRTLS